MTLENDAIGRAILEFAELGKAEDIIVESDICDDDTIPVAYLFRDYESMPELEKIALNLCEGKVLDVGAGAGSHAKALISIGFDVKAIDFSPGAVSYMQSEKINAHEVDFLELKNEKYDTLLLLMNGIGIAKRLNALENFLIHAKACLTETGKIICDSTDVSYLYQDDEGAVWLDLNSEYQGDFKFRMNYKDTKTEWFEWLYVDFNTLLETAEKVGLSTKLIFEEENQYLVELKQMQ
jgi:SAM-dependent methyltransferase